MEDNIKPEDSVSQTSKQSTSTTYRLQAKAEKAALLAQAENLKKIHELNLQQLHIEQEKEMQTLKGQIEAVDAKEKIYEQHDTSSKFTRSRIGYPDPETKRYSLNPFADPWPSTPVQHFQLRARTDNQASFMGPRTLIPQSVQYSQFNPFENQDQCTVAENYGNPFSPMNMQISSPDHESQNSPQQHTGHCSTPKLNRPRYEDQGNNMPSMEDKFIHMQRTMLDTLNLPKAELVTFDGDPLTYWTFMRSFESCVDKTDLSDSGKLSRLLQYCTGKAREVINCCAIMEPQIGYQEAKRLLHERFGNQYTISKAWISKITEGKTIKPNNAQSLRQYADDVKSCVLTLIAMGRQGEIDNQIRMVQIIEKLPYYLQGQWRKHAVRVLREFGTYPHISELVNFIEIAAQEATDPVFGASMQVTESTKVVQNKPIIKSKGNSFNVQTSNTQDEGDLSPKLKLTSSLSCHYCSENHPLTKCDTFRLLSPEKRCDIVKEKRLCFNCFSPRHWSDKCDKDSRCAINGCDKKHSRLLHVSSQPVKTSVKTLQEPVHNGHVRLQSSTCQSTRAGAVKVALPIVAVKVKDINQKYVQSYALLDSGSTNSFCSIHLLRQLGIEGQKTSLTLTTLEKENSTAEVMMVSFELTDNSGRQCLKLPRVFATSNFPVFKDNVAELKDLEQWPHLSGIFHPTSDKPKVGLIIGQDIPEALIPLDIRRGKPGEPYATKTALGWTLNGPIQVSNESYVVSNFVYTDDELSQQVERFWKIESYQDRPESYNVMSIDDKKVIQIWQTTTRLKNEHYQMKIPFRCDPPCLPNNYCVAETRLESLGRKLSKDPEKLKKYDSEIKVLLEKGYSEKMSDKDVEANAEKVWYLPHHGVTNVNKPGKLRVVFDCAAVYRGISLNSEVLQGPDLTNKLIGVLLRFREDRIAVMADIEAMFHQVLVEPNDRNVLRFLWWKNGDPTEDIEIYRMAVHLFGGVWSPSCANFALKKTADDNKDYYKPEVVETVHKNFYVDDCLKSVPTPEQAIELVKDLCSLLNRGGFKLNKWVSNDRQVIQSIPVHQRAKDIKDIDFDQSSLPVERALGVKWDTQTDDFGFKILHKERPFTRRGLLSVMSSVYDPLGFACPYILLAKRIFQNETKRKKDWDFPLQDTSMTSWSHWLADLGKLEAFHVPRCFLPGEFGKLQTVQLHHFSDASCEAYGVASYVRFVDDSSETHCTLALAKSRLAPIKTVTIPRLELTAAVLATKMDSVLRQELQTPVNESFFWTDSEIVLRYINSENRRFHTFVANRIGQIHRLTSPSQWRYVNSSQNPADDASRGLSADELLTNTRWTNGPDFLWSDSSQWPDQPNFKGGLAKDDKEVKKEVKVYQVTESQDDLVGNFLNSFSCWYKLKKAIAWILRLRHILLKRIKREDPVPKAGLTVAELHLAEEEVVKMVQRREFSQELKDLSTNPGVVKSSGPLYKLEPFKNAKGILCVGGRLQSSPLSPGAKHPMILPKNHPIGELIIRHYHQTSGHSGREYVLAEMRQRFWIIRARRQVEKVLKQCVSCARRLARPVSQKMAELPSDRVTPGKPPFTYVGVDCFGPFMVKRARSQVKRYGCLFTCLAMRAIHIEKLDSMSTDSFINALKRFESRRGRPEKIRSDNGTNFTAGEKELRQGIQQWNQTAISEHLRQREIQWEFNPPSASHMGGSWERQIRTVRKVLNALLTEEGALDDEGLSTFFCEAESIVNNRPITMVSDDPRDFDPLTPNHLLLLRSVPNLPSGVFTLQDRYRKQWKIVQFLSGVFWKRWIREYLPSIQLRQKWLVKKRNFREGDVVLVLGENTSRGIWPLGRVVKTHPGRDGLVRSVDVRTKETVLTRPVTKLCLLESTPD